MKGHDTNLIQTEEVKIQYFTFVPTPNSTTGNVGRIDINAIPIRTFQVHVSYDEQNHLSKVLLNQDLRGSLGSATPSLHIQKKNMTFSQALTGCNQTLSLGQFIHSNSVTKEDVFKAIIHENDDVEIEWIPDPENHRDFPASNLYRRRKKESFISVTNPKSNYLYLKNQLANFFGEEKRMLLFVLDKTHGCIDIMPYDHKKKYPLANAIDMTDILPTCLCSYNNSRITFPKKVLMEIPLNLKEPHIDVVGSHIRISIEDVIDCKTGKTEPYRKCTKISTNNGKHVK